ncbi:MAG: hypothetical protein KDK36_12850 [Leptospiraceae bacterium]|nr:hypothetical protein [Leptospiraceae bacterium]
MVIALSLFLFVALYAFILFTRDKVDNLEDRVNDLQYDVESNNEDINSIREDVNKLTRKEIKHENQ